MSLAWLFRLADRTHAFFLPALFVVLAGGLCVFLAATTEGGFVRQELAPRQLLGTLTLFVLLPAYLVAVMPRLLRRSESSLLELAPLADPEDVDRVRGRLLRAPGYTALTAVLGVALGLAQNPLFLRQMAAAPALHPLDVVFIVGACWLWVVAAVLFCWRISVSSALSRLGACAEVDLYRLDRFEPLARIATGDLLTVVGAMSFSALQSLDAEFRLGNYLSGFVVGTAAALSLFVLPLWGVHQRILAAKRERLAHLRGLLEKTDHGDVGQLESLAAHIERIRTLSSWPIDLEIATRVFVYIVIPPLAWVAAALVENFIDRL